MEASTCAESIRILRIESESDLQRNVPGFWIWKPAHDATAISTKTSLAQSHSWKKWHSKFPYIVCFKHWIKVGQKLFDRNKRANCVAIITLISSTPSTGTASTKRHMKRPPGTCYFPVASTTRSASSPDNFVLVFALIQNHYASWSGKDMKPET